MMIRIISCIHILYASYYVYDIIYIMYISYIRIISYIHVLYLCCDVGWLLYLCIIFVFVFSIRSTNFCVRSCINHDMKMKTDLPPHGNT